MPKPARRASTTTRKRVPRNTLSRERVIEGALALIDAEGLDAVTMPGLAKSLGVGTMSLYRHVADKDDLVNAVAERVLGGVTVTPRIGKAASSVTSASSASPQSSTPRSRAFWRNAASQSDQCSTNSSWHTASFAGLASPTSKRSGPSTRCSSTCSGS